MVYPLADYQHCFFIFLCNNVSGMYRKCIAMYRKCIAMYRACISSNWLFYNSTPNRVSLCFKFQGFLFIPFQFSGFMFHFVLLPCQKYRVLWVNYHNTIIPMKMFFCVSDWGHFVSNFMVFVSWRFLHAFLCFHLFPPLLRTLPR